MIKENNLLSNQTGNFLVKFWKGEMPLSSSFWGIYFFLSLLVTSVMGYSMQFIPEQISFFTLGIFLIYTCIGLYRSVVNYPSNGFVNFLIYICIFGRWIKSLFVFLAIFNF
jgi:hypothetical protein